MTSLLVDPLSGCEESWHTIRVPRVFWMMILQFLLNSRCDRNFQNGRLEEFSFCMSQVVPYLQAYLVGTGPNDMFCVTSLVQNKKGLDYSSLRVAGFLGSSHQGQQEGQ
jgi:hypothetical protein